MNFLSSRHGQIFFPPMVVIVALVAITTGFVLFLDIADQLDKKTSVEVDSFQEKQQLPMNLLFYLDHSAMYSFDKALLAFESSGHGTSCGQVAGVSYWRKDDRLCVPSQSFMSYNFGQFFVSELNTYTSQYAALVDTETLFPQYVAGDVTLNRTSQSLLVRPFSSHYFEGAADELSVGYYPSARVDFSYPFNYTDIEDLMLETTIDCSSREGRALQECITTLVSVYNDDTYRSSLFHYRTGAQCDAQVHAQLIRNSCVEDTFDLDCRCQQLPKLVREEQITDDGGSEIVLRSYDPDTDEMIAFCRQDTRDVLFCAEHLNALHYQSRAFEYVATEPLTTRFIMRFEDDALPVAPRCDLFDESGKLGLRIYTSESADVVQYRVFIANAALGFPENWQDLSPEDSPSVFFIDPHDPFAPEVVFKKDDHIDSYIDTNIEVYEENLEIARVVAVDDAGNMNDLMLAANCGDEPTNIQ